ncbi:hypothetical protein KQI52_16345 [bacterium]|nr:hypothetical protein [bacterium]
MNLGKLTVRIIAFMAGFLVLAEILLRTVVPACDVPPMELNTEYGFLNYRTDGQRSGLFTQGQRAFHRSRWEVNNDGWIFPEDYHPPDARHRPLIAMFGSSYIEGLWVEPDENPGIRLRENLNQRFLVYNFSITNSVPSEHLQEARYVRDTYAPEVYLFILQPGYLIGCTDLDPERTRFAVEDDTVRVVRPTVLQRGGLDGVKQLIRKSALLRYLLWNLRLAAALQGIAVEDQVDAITVRNTVYDDSTEAVAETVAQYLCRQMRERLGDNAVIVIAHGDIYHDTAPPAMHPEEAILERVAPEFGIDTIPLTDGFYRKYLSDRRSFKFDYDMHWNAYGLQTLADILADGMIPILETGFPRHPVGNPDGDSTVQQ